MGDDFNNEFEEESSGNSNETDEELSSEQSFTGTIERPDTDLSGMDPQAAKEYVLAFITSLKQTQRQKETQIKDKTLWQERVEFAKQRNESDLAFKAEERVSQIQAKIDTLKQEETELKNKVAIMKQELKRLIASPTFTVDADLLLAQLEMIVGEPDKTAEAFKEEEAKAELEKLKKKIKEEE